MSVSRTACGVRSYEVLFEVSPTRRGSLASGNFFQSSKRTCDRYYVLTSNFVMEQFKSRIAAESLILPRGFPHTVCHAKFLHSASSSSRQTMLGNSKAFLECQRTLKYWSSRNLASLCLTHIETSFVRWRLLSCRLFPKASTTFSFISLPSKKAKATN